MDKQAFRVKIADVVGKKNEIQLSDFLASTRRKVIFGQGLQAFICNDFCQRLDIKVEAFMCSEMCKRNPTLPQDIPFYLPKDFSNPEEYDVILALNERHNKTIIDLLKKHKFKNIYYSENWNRTNKIFRQCYLELYLKDKLSPSFSVNDPVIKIGDFRILGLQEPEEYSTMLEGEFFDIVAPSLFQDSDLVSEGAYEEGFVRIEKGDIVFDLGANIGMFSCVAAAKAKQVFAFEPTPETAKFCRRNAELYDNFEVIEAAVSNKNGKCDFIVNDLSGDNVNTGSNTMFAERLKGNKITVKMVSLDSFVEENNIERVDFIKADIEGAERYMLEGAKEILRKYAPKLSLCTYHLPDDPEVMKNIILKYNPNYIIEQQANKMYAYVMKRDNN